ncbi:hypothetical protein NT04LM_4304 [Listeria monocytogenes FSL F2-208]|nr:hypothetical protein NT04LM_4304 [Listeria monocytogenes FSL F2-208]
MITAFSPCKDFTSFSAKALSNVCPLFHVKLSCSVSALIP